MKKRINYFWNLLTKEDVAKIIVGIELVVFGIILSIPTIIGWNPYPVEYPIPNVDWVFTDCIVRLGAVVGIPMIVSGIVILDKD